MSLITGEFSRLDLKQASWVSLGALLYLTVFGSIVVFTAYIFLLRNVSPARAATYAYVNPVVAVLLGWAIAGEQVTLRTILAAGIIVSSVVLITTCDKRPEKLDSSKSPTPDPSTDTDADPCPTHPCA
jgi:drug/metabolite transporter (DMT)-like permease